MTNATSKRSTAVELEHPDTGKIYLANCICCAKSKLLEKGLFEDSAVTHICTETSRYKKSGPLPLIDLNHCCYKFELSQDFVKLGYRVVGKYNAKNSKIKKL